MTNNQTAAEKYLVKIREKEKEIHDKELELEALRYKASGAGGIDYSKDRVQSSPNSYLEMAISDIIQISEEIEEDKASIENIKGTAYSIVRRMDKADERAVIEWFYLNGISVVEVSEKMHLSERTVYYLKDDALETFGSFLSEM